ncbi:hypothetical protein Q1695_004046 [Nippostrongylus brasiliensis]|nr:hypothetical protein Q1695_004046 [Nippostrongylus brasiliensis]
MKENGDRHFVPYTLTQLRNGQFPKDRPVHIFTEGIFDLFHFGHVRMFRQLKEAFPNVKLTAGICSDELVQRFKGPLVMTFEERFASLKSCPYVDQVVDYGMYWATLELLDELEADLMAHDAAPYACDDGSDCFKPFKDADRFISTVRTENISTTELIQRILDRHEVFCDRNAKRELKDQS